MSGTLVALPPSGPDSPDGPLNAHHPFVHEAYVKLAGGVIDAADRSN